MNFNFAEQINPYLEQHDFAKAISIAETALEQIPATPFHDVLKNPLLHLAEELAHWTADFFNLAAKQHTVAALYFELNEFDINTDHWFIDCFAYSNDGGLDPDDMDWLSDYDTDSRTETETVFKFDEYEKLQSAFAHTELKTTDLQNARDWCEQIIIARFMELIRTAHTTAAQQNLGWAKVPVYYTEHAYDFVVRSAQ